MVMWARPSLQTSPLPQKEKECLNINHSLPIVNFGKKMNFSSCKTLCLSVFTLSASIYVGLLCQSSAQASSLVRNGGFETGDFTGWTHAGNVTIRPNGSEGSSGAAFSFGHTPNTGVLFQDLETAIDQSYSVSFDFGANGDPHIDQLLQVKLIGSNTLLDRVLSDQGPINYKRFTFGFVADSTTTRLIFSDRSSATFRIDARLDNVVVKAVATENDIPEAVPEPTTILGVAVAVLSMGATLKREQISH